jgi:hypothetical protein
MPFQWRIPKDLQSPANPEDGNTNLDENSSRMIIFMKCSVCMLLGVRDEGIKEFPDKAHSTH